MLSKIILHVIAVIVLLFVGLSFGYYIGVKAGFEQGATAQKNLVNPLDKVETFKNPFAYKNPFENVKINPFAD